MGKIMHEWFGDPFFGIMLAAALIIVFALFRSGYREKREKRRYLAYLDRKRREIREQQDAAALGPDRHAPD